MGGSLVAIIGAALALVLGWTSTDQALLFVSIGASSVAAVCMALAYSSSRAPVKSSGSPLR